MKTIKGTWDLNKPAYSNICMVLNSDGKLVLDTLKLTGKQTIIEQFGEEVSMVEVEHSYGTDEVCEDFLWQNQPSAFCGVCSGGDNRRTPF